MYNNNEALFKSILDAFSSTTHTVTLSTGGKNQVYDNLLEYNKNEKASIVDFIDIRTHGNTLGDIDIFITHAGVNSIFESVCALVPMILLPQAGDQFFTAKRLTELGAGYTVNNSKELQTEINFAIQQIIVNWPSYQDGLLGIKESLLDDTASKTALTKITGVFDNTYSYDEL